MIDREDVIRWAKEAGLHRQQHNLMSNPVQHRYSYDGYEENLERFAQAAYAAGAAAERDKYEQRLKFTAERWGAECQSQVEIEREACAKVCVELVPDMSRTANDASVWDVATFDCAAAIRARKDNT